jgi:hypothetical protein
MMRSSARSGFAGILATLLLWAATAEPQNGPGISQQAADSCAGKVAGLESFAAQAAGGKKNSTKFTEEEINSYFALVLSSKYHPSLKRIQFSFGESTLQSTAVVDCDQLATNSKKFSARLLAGMLSGVHTLSMRGKVSSGSGKAQFQLDEARYDNGQLPRFLVEEIITMVGRKQKPPFDPMQPSELPYHIDHVDFHSGYILIYQTV